jgi:acetyl-CoA acyltransferase
MGFTAERMAQRWGIPREEQDQYAFESQRKAASAWNEGRYDEQIVPIPTGIGQSSSFCRDETIRPETTVERLAKLRPAFNVKGTVTAGNSSPFSDGSAALIIMSREKADQLGLKPLARFITFAVAGVEPDVMGIGPTVAVPKALKRAGLSLNDIKLIEFNEAFAAQVLAVVRELDLPTDILNVNGGAIALGHPLGATGAKLATSLIHELRSRGGGIGLVTMCIGGGMGAAGLFEVFAA